VYTGRDFTDVMCHLERLDQPLRWTKPRRVFVNSMSDLFHESVPSEFICAVFGVMALTPQHTYQVLTKRPDRMRSWLIAAGSAPFLYTRGHPGYEHITRQFPGGYPETSWPLPNVWLGVSVEDQDTADERVPLLLQTPAAVRFVSYEPALGPVDLRHRLGACVFTGADPWATGRGLDWVIVGGESGPKARACNVEWIHETVHQCSTAGVACFVKQMGSNVTLSTDEIERMTGLRAAVPHRWNPRDRKGGDMQEWPSDLRVREFPK
jgi:protein gp37